MPSLYEKLELVGKGAYGGVYKGVHLETGQVVALKVRTTILVSQLVRVHTDVYSPTGY